MSFVTASTFAGDSMLFTTCSTGFGGGGANDGLGHVAAGTPADENTER